MRLRVAVLACVIVGLVSVSGQEPTPVKPRVVIGRSKIATKYGIVAASQPLAARAGVQILERGGNAIDAAIATNAVMGLVEPHYNGIGGDCSRSTTKQDRQALRHERRRMGADGTDAGALKSKGVTRMPSAASTRSPCPAP